jgi:hypothetical protein
MKKVMLVFLLAVLGFSAFSQSFEGMLKIDFKDETGALNAVEVKVKGKNFFIKRITGGNEKYDSYFFNSEKRELSCVSTATPKTAVVFNSDKVFKIYEQNNLKPGFAVNVSQSAKNTGQTKTVEKEKLTQKIITATTFTADVWCDASTVNFQDLIPVLRIAGFWNEVQDGNTNFAEVNCKNTKTAKVSPLKIVKTKSSLSDDVFEIPKGIQKVDLNKFINEQEKSPKLPALVKAFAGF